MRKLLIAALLLPTSAYAQDTSWRSGDRMAGTIGTSPQGQAIIQKVTQVDATGNAATTTAAQQGSTTNGQNGTIAMCAVVTGNQAYTVGTTQPCNLTPTGRLKVGISSSTNVTPATNLTTTIDSELTGCIYRATQVVWTDQYTGANACDANGNQQVAVKGGNSIATGQVSVGTTATLVAAARPGRASVQVILTAANTCYFGPAGVSTTTGYPITGTGASDKSDTAAALYAVCSATTNIGVKELF